MCSIRLIVTVIVIIVIAVWMCLSGAPQPGSLGSQGAMELGSLGLLGSHGARELGIREDLGTEYRLRFSTEIYGSKREKTVFHEYLQEACFVPTEISNNLRKLPGVYGRI